MLNVLWLCFCGHSVLYS